MRRTITLLGVVALVVAGLAVVATAQIDGDEVINACVHSRTGIPRLVMDQGDCKKNEHLASWNVAGVDGASCTVEDTEEGASIVCGETQVAVFDGVDGTNGADGTDGLNCWDLNGDGVGQAGEDTNGDGLFNADDCVGAPGPSGGEPGDDGLNCWDLNGNGIGDLEEDTNGDEFFDAADCVGPQGDTGLQGPPGAAGPAGPPADGEPDQNPMDLFMFLRVDQVPGDVTAPGHEDWVSVLGYEQLISHPAEFVVFEPFEVTVQRDRSHIAIIGIAAGGETVEEVELEVCLDDRCPVDILLSNATVVEVLGSETGQATYRFEFDQIDWTYRPFAGEEILGYWDLASNTGEPPEPDGDSFLFGPTAELLYASITGVTGESTAAGYEGWISLFGYDDGVIQVGPAPLSSGHAEHAGHLTKRTSIATGAFLESVLIGSPISEMDLEEAGAVFRIEYQDVSVETFRYGSDQVEEIGFDAGKVTWDDLTSDFFFDFVANQAF
jgi:type VI protein secretion system component Hcp